MFKPEKLEGVVIIARAVNDILHERELIAYKSHRKNFIDWVLHEGKDENALEGFALDTATVYANDISRFYRYVWEEEGKFTLELTHDHPAPSCAHSFGHRRYFFQVNRSG